MASEFTLEIITPEKITYTGSAASLTLPTLAGQITVLPGHIALVSTIIAGEIIIKSGNNQTFLAVSDGLAQINSDQVKILVNTAEHAEDIDEARAEQAHQRAQQLMTEKRDDVDYTALASKIEKELTRLKVVRSRRHHSHQPKIDQ